MQVEIVKFCEARSLVLEAWHRLSHFEETAAPSGSPPGDYTPYTPIAIIEAEGFNDAEWTLYWQIFDGVAPPAPGAVARHSIRVPGGSSFSWAPRGGFETTNGGIWVASTTPAVYTEGTASLWCVVQFLPMHNVTIFSDGP